MTSFETTITLIGGPTVLIELDGFRLLTDSTFDAQLSACSCLPSQDHRAGDPAGALGVIDAVLLSHDHHIDNLDLSGRAFLPHAGRSVHRLRLGPSASAEPCRVLHPSESARLEAADGRSLVITATPARHGPASIEGTMGEVAGSVLGIEVPGDAIYVTGDTVWYEGVAEVAKRFQPRLVILFRAGAPKPRGPSFRATMDNDDADRDGECAPAGAYLGAHNNGWQHVTESQSDLAQGFHDALAGVRRLQIAGARTAGAAHHYLIL